MGILRLLGGGGSQPEEIMIEVEKKFLINEDQKNLILQKGVFQKKTIFQDTYFDTDDFFFTTQNIWLRKRNDFFMLKRGICQSNGLVDAFEEISDSQLIGKCLKLPLSSSFESAIEKRGLIPYCTFNNVRHSYFVEPFMIDIDEADFGDFNYHIAEIELMVSEESEIQLGEEKILAFAKELTLDISIIAQPKLIAYLAQKRPKHFQALVAAKVTPSSSEDLFSSEMNRY